MNDLKVAMRYAKAVYPLAKEQNELEQFIQDINEIADTISLAPDLRAVINSPVIAPYKKLAVYDALFADNVSALSYNFIRMLIQKSREKSIKDVCRCIQVLYNEEQGNVLCEVTSARELTDDTRKRITDFVAQATKMNVLADYKLDTSLIGGVMVRVDDWVYDATIKNKLKELKIALME